MKELQTDMATLSDRDKKLEKLWEQFGDVPMDSETECIDEPFLNWNAGTHREEIWHWFDERHSKGVAYLLYRDGVDRTDVHAKMVYLKEMCRSCELTSCRYNHNEECRYVLVHEIAPQPVEGGGCMSFER